jgi:hypothetical protein
VSCAADQIIARCCRGASDALGLFWAANEGVAHSRLGLPARLDVLRTIGASLHHHTHSHPVTPAARHRYREALFNARLAEAWAGGERWAACDLAGVPLPPALTRHAVAELHLLCVD